MLQKSVAKVRLVLIIRSFWPCLHRRRFFTGKVVQVQVGPQASSSRVTRSLTRVLRVVAHYVRLGKEEVSVSSTILRIVFGCLRIVHNCNMILHCDDDDFADNCNGNMGNNCVYRIDDY